ncbi:MAG TPA: hypothetical protein VNW47_05870 [Terriglobales bacterium]|jgi:hypothetical protein|nr:hypothetical protein [Terriglobales bacterium]
MASKNQPDRWEATLLAVVLALAGAPFLFATLGSLMRPSVLTSLAIHNSGPVLLVLAGAILLVADAGTGEESSQSNAKQGVRHEL